MRPTDTTSGDGRAVPELPSHLLLPGRTLPLARGPRTARMRLTSALTDGRVSGTEASLGLRGGEDVTARVFDGERVWRLGLQVEGAGRDASDGRPLDLRLRDAEVVSDERHAPRSPFSGRGRLTAGGRKQQEHVVTVLDLSLAGLAFGCSPALEPGEEHPLALELDGGGALQLEIEVTRCDRTALGTHVAGARIVAISELHERKLARLLRRSRG